ncbi:hypothetical protein [Nitrosospira sp. Nsp18]|uniref:hypothetical protein n=1 Tax=Nitrosospira sp. Nsp18 TaxID=1855334 RepID=UPI00115F9E91|nr:hypothetical protein [Nitrosospira sp. Nsp18]
MKWLARRSSTDKYQRDILIMAAVEQNVEKFLFPADVTSSARLSLGFPVHVSGNRIINLELFKYQKSWPNMNQGRGKPV